MKRANIFLLILLILLAVLLIVRQSKAPTSRPPETSGTSPTATAPTSSAEQQSVNTDATAPQQTAQMNKETTPSAMNTIQSKQRARTRGTPIPAKSPSGPTLSTTPTATAPTQQPASTATATSNTSATVDLFAPPTYRVTLEADDKQFYPNEPLSVKRGVLVEMTFKTRSNVYYGGLDFRSSEFGTGPVLPGNTKTVSFTANQSFAIDVYWPQTQTKKYSLSVNVTE